MNSIIVVRMMKTFSYMSYICVQDMANALNMDT